MKWESFATPRTFLLTALALGASTLAGCSDATSSGDGRVQIQLTDATADFLTSADVWIPHVYVKCNDGEGEGDDLRAADTGMSHADSAKKGDDDGDEDGHKGDCKPVDLLNDSIHAFHVDLLKLHDGLVSNLTVPANLPTGKYDDLFIVVDSAKVTLKAPFHFAGGATTAGLRIAGGGKKAIRVELAQPLDVAAGQTTVVLVDFNLENSFQVRTSPTDPSLITSIAFNPRMLEKHRSHGD
jgi:hypothetical protein